MASEQSLAAEIEANGMSLEQALAYLKPADANSGTTSLRAPKAREAVAVIVADIAALQSRAFEDGARWMRGRAAEAADYARERAAMALHGSCDGSDTNRTRRDLAQSLKGQILTLPLQPEWERSDA